ncbi:MAG: chromosome segregation SMC family protein [Nanoarchaeota archaeon]
MTFIKKLVMHGFKSFPRKTEIPFTPEINVILGPNGSGKSNISDALCFVLGRLSIKSMRAAKAGNLIFLGSKAASPMKEASVELIFDNQDKVFSVDKNEISIKRIVRKNGQSIYKINNETKTRQEVLTLLAQGGIDSHGFNIILQGEIQNLVRMHPEERRGIIEEVSGISIYEIRKERSLKELSKTDEKLKEVVTILRERTSYLNNLEKERQQALKYKKLEEDIKKYKAGIISFDLNKKRKEAEKINSEILKKNDEIGKIKKIIINARGIISGLESKISAINSTIQKSTGFEQEKLNQEIANLRAEIAGLNVKTENYENKLSEIKKHRTELEEMTRNNEAAIKEMKKESPLTARKQKDIDAKKKELDRIEEERKKFYMAKSELKSLKERLDDKKILLQNYSNESDFLLKQISQINAELFDKKTNEGKVSFLKVSLNDKRELFETLIKRETELEKISYSNEHEIEKQNKLIEKISKMDICPVCKSKITEGHIHGIRHETQDGINFLKSEIENSDRELNDIENKKKILKQDIEQLNSEISRRETDLVKISGMEGKKEQIKLLQEKTEKLKVEISGIEKTKKTLEKNFDDNSNIEHKYETIKLEVQEISLRTEENVDSEISFKQRELERAKIELKQISRTEEDLNEELSANSETLDEKEELLSEKRKQEEELTEKFRKLISERDGVEKKIREEEARISEKENVQRNFEQEVNVIKIEKAKLAAETENLETDMLEFSNIEPIKASREFLIEKLEKAKEIFSRMGSVNLLSLQVYDSVKKEYDIIREKAEVIEREKGGILKVIHEIDFRKKKTFLKILNELNEIFSRNFSDLSQKGIVSLELENAKEPFEGGVNIIVKTGHGKYFDVTSLSGGEQTLVALSLIFAIQELKPYFFYILDEIDAALDKRNSEKLAELLKKYMQKGQYIIITHNDEVITKATNLYGISMHEGISKIVSLKI